MLQAGHAVLICVWFGNGTKSWATTTTTATTATPSVSTTPTSTLSTLTLKAEEVKPWIASILSYSDFNQIRAKSLHYTEMHLGYNFSPSISLTGIGYYTGLLASPESADFGDPELALDFTIPVRSSQNSRKDLLGDVSILVGSSVVLPTSKYARDTAMMAGWGANAGIERKGPFWTVKQVNLVYLFGYRDDHSSEPPKSGPSHPSESEEDIDDLFSESGRREVINSGSSAKRTFSASENRLEFIGSLTRKLLWKSDMAYLTDLSGETFSEFLRFVTRLNYGWTPNFRTFGGLVSQAPVGKPPGLFSDQTWAIRLGVFVSL